MAYINNEEFDAICEALDLLPGGDEYKALPEDKRDIIAKADEAMLSIYKRKLQSNKVTAAYIAEKRKANKNYGRTKRKKE